MMKRFNTASLFNIFLPALLFFIWSSPAVAVDVCEEGKGVPPFLAKGVPANVMLLIDNSASMYDMAYDDIEEPGFCNDDSYIAEGTINQSEWDAATTYREGTFAYVKEWNTTFNTWEKLWYKTSAGTIGASPSDGAPWSSADWDATSETYVNGDIVVIRGDFERESGESFLTYNWYMASFPEDPADTADDNVPAGTDPETSTTHWQRIPAMYGGYFETDEWYQWNETDRMFVKIDPDTNGDGVVDSDDVSINSANACSLYVSGTGSYHEIFTNDDLCEVIEKAGLTYKLIDFAAKGNYLNWLASSKLDVEKKILTGGKYENPDGTEISTDPDNYLQLESRGCLGRRMIRQVQVTDKNNDTMMLTMAVAQVEEVFLTGSSEADCKSSCTAADGTSADVSCVTECSGACDLSCLAPYDIEQCEEDQEITCYGACETKWIQADGTVINQKQLGSCKNNCDIDYTNCVAALIPNVGDADYASHNGCVSTCEGTCSSNCIVDCEIGCEEAWANVDPSFTAETTRIEFFPPTVDGFQFANTECEAAIAATEFGQVQTLAEDCLEIGKQQESFLNSNAAFNHGFQTCWGYPTVGNGDITRMKNACKNVYQEGVDPSDIELTDSGYVCMGDNADNSGYIGRCFDGLTPDGVDGCVYDYCIDSNDVDPLLEGGTCILNTVYACPSGFLWEDSLNTCVDDSDSNIQSPQIIQDNGHCNVTWVANFDQDLDDDNLASESSMEGCIEWAIRDYCGELTNPSVPDTDRPVTSVADQHFPNLPAVLVDVATNAQLGDPIKTVPARIQGEREATATAGEYEEIHPQGLLANVADDLRIGALTFNARGTKWELDNPADAAVSSFDTDVQAREEFYGCASGSPDCENRDGAVVIDYITDGEDIDTLIKSINQIKATSWTPMAEAMYNAIGYYTRVERLSPADFYKKAEAADSWGSGVDYSLGSLVKDGSGNVYWAVTEGTSAGSAPDTANNNDTGVEWELLLDASNSDPYALDPVKAHCQSNNIVLLTDGASTGDLNPAVGTLVDVLVTDGDQTNGCDRFAGSTFADNMAYYGQNETGIYAEEQYDTVYPYDSLKEPIQTYVVTTGALRVDGPADDCRADVLLTKTAEHGGTERYYPGEDAVQLQEQLEYIFSSLGNRASAGSAASVISSSRGGEGAIYQAIFWPEKKVPNDVDNSLAVDWVGDVHALFIDSKGLMYEDTNGDAKFDAADKQISVYYDESQEKSMACYGTVTGTVCAGISVPIEQVKFLWSAADWLSPVKDSADDMDFSAGVNRSPYLSKTKKRYIYTWNDLNDDGIVDRTASPSEWIPFEGGLTEAAGAISWNGDNVSAITDAESRSSVLTDFDVPTVDEANNIINWMRGDEDVALADPTFRSRLTQNNTGDEIIWRLGDVIHSTPMTVASPAEAYHLLYNDLSYAEFFSRWKQRRHMIYFGGNDGMLHAVNGGFYKVKEKGFCRTDTVDANGNCDETAGGYPDLGAEMWSYVPYNLLPHLGCMTKKDYTAENENHKYYVDLRPRIFDVQIFEEESACASDTDAEACKHPNGWGTILVGGMRLGGAPVEADDLTNASLADPREFISSYFVFDITDPENPPILLGETTRWKDGLDTNGDHIDLGRSSNISTMVIMKKDGVDPVTGFRVPASASANAYDEASNGAHNQWYLILGSGPQGTKAMKGVSDQTPRLAVLPLDWLVTTSSSSRRELRIPAAAPSIAEPGGTIQLDIPAVFEDPADVGATPGLGFTGDLITIDGDINPSSKDYMADAVYFGTTEGDFVGDNWVGGGRLYRLMTRRKYTVNPTDPVAPGDKWLFGSQTVAQQWSRPDEWKMTTLINNGQPITAAPSVGYDGQNFWVFFGTGRFFDANDKSDTTQQSFYGIKEPMAPHTAIPNTMEYKGTTVVAPTVHGAPPFFKPLGYWPNSGATVGNKGLLKTDEIRVPEIDHVTTQPLSCRDGSTDCIPDNTNVVDFLDLINYMAGRGAPTDPAWHNSADGWYYDFYPYGNRERNVGQATLFGGLALFTTYQPYSDPCMAEGVSYLYGLFYMTGTAWDTVIFGEPNGKYDSGHVKEKFSVGPGLATTPNLHVGDDGSGKVKAFLQSSTGEIIRVEHDTATRDTHSGRTGWKQCLE